MKYLLLLCFSILCTHNVLSQSELQRKKTAEYYFKQGENAFATGNYETALLYYDSSIYINPSSEESLFSRAIARETVGDHEGAIADYGAVEFMNPNFTEATWSKAILRYRIKQYQFAYNDFKKLLDQEDLSLETNAIFYGKRVSESGVSEIGTMENMHSNLRNYLGLCAHALENYQLAVQHYTDAIRDKPSFADAYVNRAITWESMNQDEYAIKDLNAALQIDPLNELALANLGRLDSRSGNPQLQIETYSAMLKGNPEYAEAYAKRGIAKLNYGDLEGALQDYDSAILYDSRDYRKWLNRGIILEQLKRYEMAITDLKESVRLRSTNEEAYFHLGNIYSQLKAWNSSAYNYTMAINFAPDYAEAYYNRAIALYYLKQKDKACADLDKAEDLGLFRAADTRKRMCKIP